MIIPSLVLLEAIFASLLVEDGHDQRLRKAGKIQYMVA